MEYESPEDAVARARHHIFAVLKVGERKHLEQLADGRLRFRWLSYYSAKENQGKACYDAGEGTFWIGQPERSKVLLSAEGSDQIELELASPFVARANLRTPVFCLYSLRAGLWAERLVSEAEVSQMAQEINLPLDMDRHGDAVWLITEGLLFKERVKNAARELGLGLAQGSVAYGDFNKMHGRLEPSHVGFLKAESYAHEQEYRFKLLAPAQCPILPDPFILDVGSLRDVSLVMSVQEFRTNLRFSLPGD